ncbi:MAG: catalase [Saprospiraceae bacterium]|nr:catalase [Saprospiraceae bacterium]
MSLANKTVAAPSSNWKETLLPAEAQLHAEHLLAFEEIRKIKDAQYGKGRQLHRKGLLGLHGRFEVLSDLPDYAKFGLFATPATYDAWIRLSNGGMDRAADHKPDIRGFSIKILGLKGPGALGSGDTNCQDFLMIQRAAFGFATSKDFVDFVHGAARGPVSLFKYLFSKFGFLGGFRKLGQIAKAFKIPFTGFATEKFYTATPFACGPYAARMRMLPASTTANANAQENWSSDFLAHLSKGDLRFEVQLQFFVDEARTPIEDATNEWPEAVAPFVTVAILTIPAQDTESTEGTQLAADIEAAAFDPWNAFVEHRPLGEVMRARKVVYYQSQVGRKG